MLNPEFSSKKKFHTEFQRLLTLWKTVDFSFEATRRQLSQAMRESRIDPSLPVFLPSEPEVKIAGNHYVLLQRLKSQFPRYVRETIFVRLVTTLEVFLVDLAREILMSRIDLLKTKKVIQMTHAEALSLHSTAALREKILAKELRQLHSAGIQEIAKFYDSHFGIRFSECMQGIGSLWEIHERRHVLVHRLGRADQQYRHKYHYNKKASLTAEPGYLRDAFAAIESLVESVLKKAAEVASAQQEGIRVEPKELVVELEVAAASEAGDRLLSRRFHFAVNSRTAGDRTVALSDILVLSRKSEQGRVLVLSGEREDVRGYLNEIQKYEKKGLLSVFGITVQGEANGLLSESRDSTLPLATLEEIARRLPKRPWPKSIHKEVARAIGISNTQCSRAMTQILKDERLLSLVAT